MFEFQMVIMMLGYVSGVTAFLADVRLVTSLLVGVRNFQPVKLPLVGFQGTPLGKSFVARTAFIWTNTCLIEKGIQFNSLPNGLDYLLRDCIFFKMISLVITIKLK